MAARGRLAEARAARGLSSELGGILLALLAMCCFGSMDGISKFLVGHYPPALVLWLRHVVAVPLVLLVLWSRGLIVLARSARPWLQLARTTLLVIEMGIVLLAFRSLPLADVHAVLAVTPLMVTALAVPVLGERVGWRRWLAVAAGFAGVLLIIRPGFGTLSPMLLLVLLCSVMYAVYNIMTRLVAKDDPAETSWLWQSIGGAILLTFVGPFFWVPLVPAHIPLLLVLAGLGAIGHYCLIRALATVPAVVVQPFTYTLLVWATVIGYVVFGDLPDGYTIVGAVIVAAAGMYAAWREHVRKSLQQ